MAFHVGRYVSWQAGPGTPVKYTFSFDADLMVEDVIDDTAVININGTVSFTNHPTNSRNSWAASDFAVLTPGNIDVSTHPFVQGTSYYQQPIPFLPDPQNTDQSKILVQFRGDTWVSDPVDNNNRSSLYILIQGLVANQEDQEITRTFPINISYEIPVPSSGDTPVLAWITSGADNSTTYGWMNRQVWATWFDLDYRPGAVADTIWKSHNRATGKCHVYNGSKFLELRTAGAPSAMGNPPSIYHDNKWYNGARIGVE